MARPPRFLIVKLSAIGDVLHATPVARALKKHRPDCHITWIVGKLAAPMLRCNPDIDQLYVWPREEWEEHLRRRRFGAARRMWRELKDFCRANPFDIALDVQGLFISGLVAKASGAPRRIGMGGTKEGNRFFMTETVPWQDDYYHVIKRYLSVLQPLGVVSRDYRLTLRLPPEAQAFARRFLAGRRLPGAPPLIAVAPFTTWPSKNWPAEYFAQTLRDLSPHSRLLLCGGPADRAAGAKLIALAGAPVIDATGKTSLLELAALLQNCDLLLACDTGALHMAVALNIPTVSIFGGSDPRKYGPLADGHVVLQGAAECTGCNKTKCRRRDLRCLHSIAPATVAAQCLRLLPAPPSR